VFPTELRRGEKDDPFSLILDIGATIDASAEDLVTFALMGSAYAKLMSANRQPRVALLSNGSEASKGTPEVNAAHAALVATTELNFIGNIEVLDIPRGVADVIATSGFVGNVVLKMLEGVSETVVTQLRNIRSSSKVGPCDLARLGLAVWDNGCERSWGGPAAPWPGVGWNGHATGSARPGVAEFSPLRRIRPGCVPRGEALRENVMFARPTSSRGRASLGHRPPSVALLGTPPSAPSGSQVIEIARPDFRRRAEILLSKMLGGRWKPMLLWYVHHGVQRFSGLQPIIVGVSEKMLYQQLRELERDGLLTRAITGPRVVH